MNKLTKLIGAAAAATMVAASGSAFTNSIGSMPATDVVGYGATSVSGATLDTLTYSYNTAKSSITGVTLVLLTDTSASTVSLAFNDLAPASCGTGVVAADSSTTTYSCTNTIETASLTKTAVFVD